MEKPSSFKNNWRIEWSVFSNIEGEIRQCIISTVCVMHFFVKCGWLLERLFNRTSAKSNPPVWCIDSISTSFDYCFLMSLETVFFHRSSFISFRFVLHTWSVNASFWMFICCFTISLITNIRNKHNQECKCNICVLHPWIPRSFHSIRYIISGGPKYDSELGC